MLNKNIIFALISLCSIFGHAQTISEVFQGLNKQYSIAKPLQYKSSYVLYKDFDSKKIEESYTGVFYKNALNEVYMKIDNTEFINSKKINVTISHSEKAVQVSNPVDNYFGNFDIKQLLDLCKVASFVDFKSYWQITLTPKAYSSLPYSKIVLNISKTYFLQKQVFYYNSGINFSKDYQKSDIHYPRLEISYNGYNRNPINPSVFNSSTYFTFSGKKGIILSQRLKKYEIIDQRIISNNIK